MPQQLEVDYKYTVVKNAQDKFKFEGFAIFNTKSTMHMFKNTILPIYNLHFKQPNQCR